MKQNNLLMSAVASIALVATASPALASDVYGPYPITLKGYDGDKTNSVSYSGQVGRQLLHNSLKKAIGSGAALDVTMSYFNGADGELALLDPKSSDSFKVDVTDINTVSKTNLSGKAYKGSLSRLARQHDRQGSAGIDDHHGGRHRKGLRRHARLRLRAAGLEIHHGRRLYHQACDNYLDEKMNADNKPNDKPYKDGAYYTGKEHSWDEAFGYGVPPRTA